MKREFQVNADNGSVTFETMDAAVTHAEQFPYATIVSWIEEYYATGPRWRSTAMKVWEGGAWRGSNIHGW